MSCVERDGFKRVVLDFGLYDLATEERPWPSYSFPASFVELVGSYGFEIKFLFYGVQKCTLTLRSKPLRSSVSAGRPASGQPFT